jgi:MFS family permease
MDKNLFFDRRFWPLFWTQFLGAFNDNVFKNALVILITFKAYSMLGLSPKDMVALASGIFILPFFIFSPIAGQIADKYSKSKLIYWIKVWELLAMALGAIGFYSENLYLLMFTLFFMGLQSTFFGPIKYSILPELLRPEEMLKGNALVGMGTFISILLGTILGGTLIALGDNAAFAVSLAVILLAVFGILTGKAVPYLAPCDQQLKLDFAPIRPIKTVLTLSRRNSEVHQSIRGISWFWFLGAAVLSIIPPYCHEILNANELIVTYFLALFSVGVGIGSMVCEKICKGDVKLGTVPIGAFGMTLFLFDLFLVGMPNLQFQSITQVLNSFTGLRISIDMLLFSICGGFFIIPLYTLMQVKTESTIRSRIVAANNIANAMYMVIASVLLIVFFQSGLSIPQVLGVLAILNLVFTSYIFYRRPEFIHEVKSLLRPN